MMAKILTAWRFIQELASLEGGLYVDMFAITIIVRLLAVLKGFPPVTASEAALWGTTIAAFAVKDKFPGGQA